MTGLGQAHTNIFSLETKEAIKMLQDCIDNPQFRQEFLLEPGQIIMIDNRRMLHGRRAFEDFPELSKKRLLERLWLVQKAHLRTGYGKDIKKNSKALARHEPYRISKNKGVATFNPKLGIRINKNQLPLINNQNFPNVA